jgi:hypothetical protein
MGKVVRRCFSELTVGLAKPNSFLDSISSQLSRLAGAGGQRLLGFFESVKHRFHYIEIQMAWATAQIRSEESNRAVPAKAFRRSVPKGQPTTLILSPVGGR